MTFTNAVSLSKFSASTVGVGAAVVLRGSTVEDWTETLAIMRDPDLMEDIEAGLAEIERGDRLYSFEDLFGEPPEDAA